MKKLYAFKLEAYVKGTGKSQVVQKTNSSWAICVHEKTFCLMKGKINNVAVYFSKNRSHVAIFPLSEIPAQGSKSFIMMGQRIHAKRLCIIQDGVVTSICEGCKHYVGCIANDFHHCEGLPSIERSKPAVLDFSSLTFVGPGHARALSSYYYDGVLEQLDLSEEAIASSKKAYHEAGKLAAKSRKHRQTHCSKCVLSCPKVRYDVHRTISRAFLGEIYDVYLKTLFGSTSITQELRWCHSVHLGYDPTPRCSERECRFLTKIFQSPGYWAGVFSIRPFYAGHFLIQLGWSYYATDQVILDAASVYKIFSPGETDTATVQGNRDGLILAYNLFATRVRGFCAWSGLPLKQYIAGYTKGVATRSLCIPGTSVLIHTPQRARTDREILDAIKAEAAGAYAHRKDMVNAVQRTHNFKCALYSRILVPADRRILPASELASIVKECLV